MSAKPEERPLPTISFLAILASVGILLAVLLVQAACTFLGVKLFGVAAFTQTPWKVLYIGHAGMLIASLAWIAALGRGRFSEFGFRRQRRGYASTAVAFGIAFGVVMLAADYWKNAVTRIPPEHFQLSLQNVVGLLSFEGLYAGTMEEILFRGLLLTFLMQRMCGRVRLGRFDLHIAGVIVALLFCLAHAGSFWTEPFAAAAAQQVYAFAWGLCYAYWFEKSGSLWPSIIGHNVGNFVEDALVFLMVWRWS